MPAKFRTLVAALIQWGATVDKPSKGSHRKVRYGDRVYVIPAHAMGSEVPDVYIRGVCKAFGFDYAEFRKSL